MIGGRVGCPCPVVTVIVLVVAICLETGTIVTVAAGPVKEGYKRATSVVPISARDASVSSGIVRRWYHRGRAGSWLSCWLSTIGISRGSACWLSTIGISRGSAGPSYTW